MCIRDRGHAVKRQVPGREPRVFPLVRHRHDAHGVEVPPMPVSYTHLRAHETVLDLVCRLLLEKKKKAKTKLELTNDNKILINLSAQRQTQLNTLLINTH